MSSNDPGTVAPSNGNQESLNKGKKSERIENNVLKKRQKRYLLTSNDPSPSLLVAQELAPVALCNKSGDLEVLTRGVTMSLLGISSKFRSFRPISFKLLNL